MKNYLFYCLFMLLITSCKNNCNEVKSEKTNLSLNKIDTLYSDEVLREYARKFVDYKSELIFKYFDKKDSEKNIFYSGDTMRFRVLYLSQKFPELNENYTIHLNPVSENFTCKRLNRNNFEIVIDSKTDMITFDIALSCEDVVFKYAEFDNENNLTYISQKEVGLSRFYEPVKEGISQE